MNCPLFFALIGFFAVSLAQQLQCGNTHTQSTMISVSIARTSVDKIGRSEYLAIVNEAVNRILPAASSSSHVALNTFGGGGASVSATNSIHALGNHAFSSLSSSITGLAASANWDVNVANDVGSAILAGNSVLGSASGQKYHLLFTSGNPLQTGFGDGTDPSHPSDPCTAAIEAKQAGIQTYVVLIGEQGVNFVQQYYTCVGEFGAADIIVINPASASYTALTSKLCKPNGIDMKITEFNPNAGRQFIEVLNRGAPTAIQACFGTNTAGECATSSQIGTGAYFVASEGGYISTGAAGGQVVASFTGYTFPVTGIYDVNAYVSGSSSASNTVSYNTGNGNNFQNSFDGRSLELRAIGFNNQYGANWRLSCYESSGIEGTPGVRAATIGCPLTEYSCTNGDQSAVLSATPLCNNNGGSGLLCTTDGAAGNLCQCSSALYTDVDTCTAMPAPTSMCLGYVLPDPLKVGINWLHLVWDSVEYDGEVSYTITYMDAQQSLTDASQRYAVYATDNYFTNYAVTGATPPGIEVIAGYDIMGLGTNDETDRLTVPTCSVTTLQPTSAPPTGSPTAAPTYAPTRAPTGSPSETPSSSPVETLVFEECVSNFALFDGAGSISMEIEETMRKLRVTLTASNGAWFGVGFGSHIMQDTYAVVVHEQADTIQVSQYTLSPGGQNNAEIIDNALFETESADIGNSRVGSLILDWESASGAAANSAVYNFTAFLSGELCSLPIIWAKGVTATFGYHGIYKNNELSLPSCRCDATNTNNTRTLQPTLAPVISTSLTAATTDIAPPNTYASTEGCEDDCQSADDCDGEERCLLDQQSGCDVCHVLDVPTTTTTMTTTEGDDSGEGGPTTNGAFSYTVKFVSALGLSMLILF